jgi:hypothetical protein
MTPAQGPRHRWIDGLFNRTDALPDAILAGVSMLVVLLVALWLFGAILPNSGRPGPLVFDESPPAALGWLRTGDEPEVIPADGWADHRGWLDENLCAVTASWDGQGERQALARRLSDDATLCTGLERSLARSPLAPLLGSAFSAVVGLLLSALLAWLAWRGSLAFFHIRRAYRRLYLSEHRTDHEEDAASLTPGGSSG